MDYITVMTSSCLHEVHKTTGVLTLLPWAMDTLDMSRFRDISSLNKLVWTDPVQTAVLAMETNVMDLTF